MKILYDENTNVLNLKATEYIYEFKQLPVPTSMFYLYNENDITVLGDLPSTENNEILVPDSFCDFDKKKCKNKIGDSINLPVKNA